MLQASPKNAIKELETEINKLGVTGLNSVDFEIELINTSSPEVFMSVYSVPTTTLEQEKYGYAEHVVQIEVSDKIVKFNGETRTFSNLNEGITLNKGAEALKYAKVELNTTVNIPTGFQSSAGEVKLVSLIKLPTQELCDSLASGFLGLVDNTSYLVSLGEVILHRIHDANQFHCISLQDAQGCYSFDEFGSSVVQLSVDPLVILANDSYVELSVDLKSRTVTPMLIETHEGACELIPSMTTTIYGEPKELTMSSLEGVIEQAAIDEIKVLARALS
ncbi:hypothetical protein VCHA53O466_50012 [Vibrio chagasii]|nr:hypothetical protein VCHA53O466_50012 [Vibrio chagasii]